MTRSPRRWLGRNVIALGVVSLLTDASSEMILPLLPLFVAGLPGGGALALGVVEGIAEATSAVVKYASGAATDRSGRRAPWVLAGYGLSNLAKPLLALALVPWHVVAVRAIDRVGKGLRTSPRDALLSDSVNEGERGRAFGFHRAMDHIGAIIGPLVAIALLSAFAGDVRIVFAVAVVPGVLAVVAVVAGVREVERPAAVAPVSAVEAQDATPRAAPRALRTALVPIGVFALGHASDAFLLLVIAEKTGDPRVLPLLSVLLHVVKAGGSLWSGGLVDRIGARRVLVAGWLLHAGIYAAFALTSDPWIAAGLLVVYGMYHALSEGPERALVAALAPPSARGRAFGAYHLTVGLVGLVASIGFGLVWEWVDPRAAFAAAAALGLIAAVMMGRARELDS